MRIPCGLPQGDLVKYIKNEFGKAAVAKDGTINAVDLHLAVERKKTDVDSVYQLIRSLS